MQVDPVLHICMQKVIYFYQMFNYLLLSFTSLFFECLQLYIYQEKYSYPSWSHYPKPINLHVNGFARAGQRLQGVFVMKKSLLIIQILSLFCVALTYPGSRCILCSYIPSPWISSVAHAPIMSITWPTKNSKDWSSTALDSKSSLWHSTRFIGNTYQT